MRPRISIWGSVCPSVSPSVRGPSGVFFKSQNSSENAIEINQSPKHFEIFFRNFKKIVFSPWAHLCSNKLVSFLLGSGFRGSMTYGTIQGRFHSTFLCFFVSTFLCFSIPQRAPPDSLAGLPDPDTRQGVARRPAHLVSTTSYSYRDVSHHRGGSVLLPLQNIKYSNLKSILNFLLFPPNNL